jgi:hypothetical protein
MFAPTITTVMEAVKELGWAGEVVGPLAFGGVRFWAVARVTVSEDPEHDGPEVRLAGCLVAGSARRVVREASLLAAYAPRAVLVDQAQDLTSLLVDAAILDQGVVTVGSDGVQVLSTAGPRVSTGPVSAREQGLLDEVLKACQAAQTVTVR